MFGDVDGAGHHHQGYARLLVFFDDLIRRGHRSVRCRFSLACPLILLATIFNKMQEVALILLVYMLTMGASWDWPCKPWASAQSGPAGFKSKVPGFDMVRVAPLVDSDTSNYCWKLLSRGGASENQAMCRLIPKLNVNI
jgi:hypothetical protein